MAFEKSPLTLIRSPAAIDELDAIWKWNAAHYSVAHADRYLRYLNACIDKLTVEPARGRSLGTRPDLRYILIRRKSRGHGHLAVYRVTLSEVRLLHIFHTAQDWQNRMADD